MITTRQSVVVLDRDGVINVDTPGRYVCSAAEWVAIDGALAAMARLSQAGLRVYVVSNQSGIGRGLFTEDALAAMHAKLLAELAQHGGQIAGWFFCPHRPEDDCGCRKPRTGLLEAVARDSGTALDGAPFIGDKWSDLVAARAMNMRGMLVGTGQGQLTLRAHAADVAEYFLDLAAAANALLAGTVAPG